MRFVRKSTGRCAGLVLLLIAAAGCSGQSGSGSATAPDAPEQSAATPSESLEPLSTPPPVTLPNDWFDIELTTSVAQAQPGDTVDVSVVCPSRGTSFAASFEVVHPDLRFAQQEVPASEPDRYSTSFVVPYWLEPGELQLRGGCPRPPGECNDTDDCQQYETDPTPLVTLPLVSQDDEPWDSWRPITEPNLDPIAEVDATLPGGAVVTATDPGQVRLDAAVGDRIQVTAECPGDAEVDGARFVIVPLRTLSLANDARDDADWSTTADPDQPGRYVVSSDNLRLASEVLDDPLPLFAEVAPLSVSPVNETVAITGDIVLESGIIAADTGDPTLYVTAVCEDVGMPFDPRSIDLESASLGIVIWLSE